MFDLRLNVGYSDLYFVDFLSNPLTIKRDIAVTILLRCMCVCASGFVRAITPTFMHGFQNNLTQLMSLRRRSAI